MSDFDFDYERWKMRRTSLLINGTILLTLGTAAFVSSLFDDVHALLLPGGMFVAVGYLMIRWSRRLKPPPQRPY